MKKLVLIFLIFVTANSFAQTDEKTFREQADHYFSLEQFNLSIDYYRQAIDGGDVNAEISYRLAESYRKTFNYEEAGRYYSLSKEIPLSMYYYALMQKLNGRYAESIASFDSFIEQNHNNNSLLQFVEQAMIDRAGSEAAINESNSESDGHSITLESFNTEFNDYAPSVADTTKLMFTSGRMRTSVSAVDERYGEGFTDIYYFEKQNGQWNDHSRAVRSLNTRFNDGSGTYNRTGNKYYYTVCGKDGSQCRIVVTELRSGKWSDPRTLNENINAKNFDSKHPAVSPGGDTLLFATDRTGGEGGFDIWISVDSGNDDWGPAMNAGNGINTRMNELAPAFARFNHVFFFSSDGHQGLGGMDLYMAKRFSDGRQAVYNLGFPFNSSRDDCFISFANNRLFISSNREDGVGGFDIYSSSIKSPLAFISRLSLKHQAGRNNIALASLKSEGSWVDLFSSRKEDRIEYEDLTYEKKKIVDKMVASRMAKKQDKVNEFSDLSKEEFEQLSSIAQSQIRRLELQRRYKKALLASITPKGNDALTISGVLVDSVGGKLLGSINIFLMNEQGEVLKVTSTNESGVFRLTNVPGGENLYLRYQSEGTEGNEKTRPIINDMVVMADTPDTFTFDNIYFDTDHYDLRIEAREVLNKLGDFLKLIPDSQVEIFAYADDRGADDYNFQLSKKRGEEVKRYLGTIGVDETSIAIVAKGRQIQKDDVINDAKRQFNRRVEFYINGERSSTLVTADSNK